MPEEINRLLTDHVANFLFCPTEQAIKNLKNEGIGIENSSAQKPIHSSAQLSEGNASPKTNYSRTNPSRLLPITYDQLPIVAMVGDVMLDAAMYYRKHARKPGFDIAEKFILATIHRAENTDDPSRLKSIFKELNMIGKEVPIYLPLHPRTRKILEALNLKTSLHINIKIIEPVSYLEMIYLLEKCTMVMTDSGGLQKEAFFFKKLCVTLHDETEWVELVENGFN